MPCETCEDTQMKVLFIGAHTDDEISTAGTLVKLKERGHEIFLSIFSFCEMSSKALGHPENVLEHEFACSADTLGLKPQHVHVHRYPVRRFPQLRQGILEDLVILKKKIKPHLVFIPNTNFAG